MAAATRGQLSQAPPQCETGLLERAAELDALGRCFDGARSGAGSATMVCGPAGIGKTTLVEAFLAGMEEPEAPMVFRGACDDLIAPRAFGPFRDMVHSTGLLPDELALHPNREDLLVNLLGVLDRPNRPAVMVVEDAQWADDASIDVMRYLARRLASLHAMLIVTIRDDDLDGSHPMQSLLSGSSGGSPVRLELGPLSLESVQRLGHDSGLDPRYVHEVSGGNPRLARQLLSADPDDVTRLAQETLAARVGRMSDEGRAVLQALSVLPEGADPTVARTLFADRPGALHEAESTGLLVATVSHIRFRNELGRTAVLESMSFGQRMAATDGVLQALTGSGEDPTLLVHIARAAGDGPRATRFALDLLDHGRLDRRAGAVEHREMWDLTGIALECTTELPVDRVARLHAAAARSGREVGCHTEALRHAERAIQLLAGTDDRALASAWMTLADLHGDGGDHLRARTALRNARSLLEATPMAVEWARVTIRLAASAMLAGDKARSIDLATGAVELAEANHWTDELVQALGVRGVAAGGPGTPAGLDDLTRAVELGVVTAAPEHHAANLLASAESYLRVARSAEAAGLVDEAERTCEGHGLDRLLLRARSMRARILLHQGRTAEAETLATALVDGGGGPGADTGSSAATLARILIRRGAEEGVGLAERAWSGAVATGEIERMANAGLSRLEQLWTDGEEEPLRQFARYLAGLGERHHHHRLRAEALRVLQRMGEPVEVFDGCPAPLAAALAGDHHRAAELWEEAGEPYARGLELVESTDAPAAFEGLRLLERTGSARIADLVRNRLRSRGVQGVPRGPRKTADGGVAVLTGRQQEVLALIARGHTNAEIAAELYVARRTVDNHVSAILSRLGVEGRCQAVDEAVARGLLDR